MADQLNVKVGDKVAILTHSGIVGTYIPQSLATIRKITPKRIETGMLYVFDRTGKSANSYARGKKLSTDPTIINELQKKLDAANADREKRKREEADRDSRKTYQLANKIVNNWSSDPVADLELLGETYLQRILDDIAKAKEGSNA